MNYDMPVSSNYSNFVVNATSDVRATFIRKVYMLFFVSILVTVGVGFFAATPAIAPTLLAIRPLLFFATIGLLIGMFFAKKASGLNVALLYAFAAVEGLLLGPMVSIINEIMPGVPTQAALLSVSVFGGLSMYVLQSRKDFSYLGGMLFMSLIALLIAGFVMMFFHVALLNTIYCVVGILIFSGYVLYDTSQIIHHLQPDEAVTGAIELYLDFLNLFVLILRLLGIFNSNDD